MAISTGNLMRASDSLKTLTLLSQLQSNTLQMFQWQQRVATGKQLLSVSDDPSAAEKIARFKKFQDGQEQILSNLSHADNVLTAGDTALGEIGDLLIDAARVASEQAGSLQSADERASQAIIIDGIIDQLMNVGNRQFQGLFLFGGRETEQSPFDTSLGRVALVGDGGDRKTLVDPEFAQAFNVLASDIFDTRSEITGGYANFDVQLSGNTRLTDIGGAVNAGVRLGTISVTEGATHFQVDLSGVDTVTDLIAKFDDAATTAGTTLTMSINGDSLRISSGALSAIQVEEVGSGKAAADLGIKKSVGAGASLDGDDANRRMTLTTAISDLAAGPFPLPNGVSITNGTLSTTVTFTGATTVQDVLNALNESNTGILASINASGNGIEVENLMAGSALVIGENGGTDAEALGIRTLDTSVSLSRLNGFRGIHPVSGSDIRITDAGGTSFEVDLSSAQTVGDVIDIINAASALAGSSINAQTSLGGAGFRLTGAAGAGSITVDGLNLSPVAAELGINKTGSSTVLEGDRVGSFYQTGIFSALYRLRDALVSDNSSEITEAGSQINAMQRHVASLGGEVGARSKAMQSRVQQTEDAVASTEILLSELENVDFVEAVTKFQQAQTALQATLMSGSQASNLSLLDFLR